MRSYRKPSKTQVLSVFAETIIRHPAGDRPHYRVRIFNLLNELLYDTDECYHAADAERRAAEYLADNEMLLVTTTTNRE